MLHKDHWDVSDRSGIKIKEVTFMDENSGQMDPKTQHFSPKHPYALYQNTHNWALLSGAIDDLVKNRDLVVQTDRTYIVGYLCKILVEGALTANPLPTEPLR